jgi:uncharacterized repeat protein (TIGR03803 family)
VLNFSLCCRKAWWAVLGGCLVLVNAPAFSATYSTVFAFDLHTTAAGVVEGSGSNRGYLFGTVNDTSLTYGGAIYKAPASGGAPQVIYQLKDSDGYAPQATMLLGSDGNLYGTTQYGPRSGISIANGAGTVFRVAQDGSGYTTLHLFSGVTGLHPVTGASLNADGIYPNYSLIQDSQYLYGVTQYGGLYGSGTVFRIRKSDGVMDVLHHFAAIDDVTNGTNSSGEGANPSAALLLASDGRLYGVTSGGGANVITTSLTNQPTGTIFALNVDGGGFETLYNFSALDDTTTGVNGDGVQPQGALVEASPGVLVGTASGGGTPADTTLTGLGTLFKFDVAGRTLEVLHSFDNTTGATPTGKLLLGSDGRVYGTTNGGSSTSDPVTALGVIYSIDPAIADYTMVHALTFAEGSGFIGGLTQASDGDLYGVVAYGNACTDLNVNGYGGVFRYSLTTNANSSGYANCTTYDSSSGGGAFSPWFLLLFSALGLAPPVRRRLCGFPQHYSPVSNIVE